LNVPAVLAKSRTHGVVVLEQLNRDVHNFILPSQSSSCVERRGLCALQSRPHPGRVL
jgi:hypothetical protein